MFIFSTFRNGYRHRPPKRVYWLNVAGKVKNGGANVGNKTADSLLLAVSGRRYGEMFLAGSQEVERQNKE